ncbi:hypothetical protein AB9T89_10445 [Flavobacterium oncorhynchi]|uniref:hypothetical protein n=1 Tax=Flavobacterium oncorhynchi TaxID=728056 RepID=UPI00351A7701
MKKYILILLSTISFGQASNQMVSFTQAQSLGFSLNSGQSHVTSNQCMTKSDALTKYNLNAANMSSFSANQLVPKNNWATGVVGNYFDCLVNDHGESATCQNAFLEEPLYSSASYLAVGVSVFFDAQLTTPALAMNYKFRTLNKLVSVNNSGVIFSIVDCTPSYQWNGKRGSLSCVGGQIALANPVNVTVYSASATLDMNVFLYTDAELTQPYTLGNSIRIEDRIFSVNASGMITSIAFVGDPC